jgi:hypothetical protein
MVTLRLIRVLFPDATDPSAAPFPPARPLSGRIGVLLPMNEHVFLIA